MVFAAEELIRDHNRWHPPSDKLPVPPRPASLRAAARRRGGTDRARGAGGQYKSVSDFRAHVLARMAADGLTAGGPLEASPLAGLRELIAEQQAEARDGAAGGTATNATAPPNATALLEQVKAWERFPWRRCARARAGGAGPEGWA